MRSDSGQFVSVPLPELYSQIDARVLGGSVAVVSLVFAACAGLTWLVLRRLRVGRHLYALGGNAQAAYLSGVPVVATLCVAYALSGLFAAVAGVCQAAPASPTWVSRIACR